MANLKTKERGNEGQLEEPVPEDVQILLTSKEDSVSMRSLGVSRSAILLLIVAFIV